jgi:O-methyltransferase
MSNIKSFDSAFNAIGTGMLVGKKKLKNIYNELIQTVNLKGNTAEIGVYKGHTSKFIHFICEEKKHYCYDTFKGVALSDPSIDKHPNGDFACSLEEVKEKLGEENIFYKVGIFPNTFFETNEIFSFVHSDTDTYAGTKATLDCFSQIMFLNGKIFFDDYKWRACPGVEKAVKEFLEHNNNYLLREFEDQCSLTKIA